MTMNQLEQAIENLKAAEALVNRAADLLEDEGNSMTPRDHDDLNRQIDLRTSAAVCQMEIARQVRLRHRFLVSVRDGYEPVQ